MLLVPITGCCLALVACLGSRSGGRVIGDALFGVLLAAQVRVAIDIVRSRVDLTTDGLVFHQVVRTKVIPSANITGFEMSPRGYGGQVMVRQLVGADHTSLALSGYRSPPVPAQMALRSWLIQLLMHRPRADRAP